MSGAPLRNRPPGSKNAKHVSGQEIVFLKKGELLFSEGDTSTAMYLLRAGAIRLFAKRGQSDVEIEVIRSGQVIGELAFLDGNPRSVSGEALMDCELLQVSSSTFAEALRRSPEWLKILLKTVVTRLRAATSKIRQIELSNVSLVYSVKEGVRSGPNYQFLSPAELGKACIALLLASRKGDGVTQSVVDMVQLEFYANKILGLPSSKLASSVDILIQHKVVSQSDEELKAGKLSQIDADKIDHLIRIFHEDGKVENSKKIDMSAQCFSVMKLLAEHILREKMQTLAEATSIELSTFDISTSGLAFVDFFKVDDLNRLIRLGYLLNVDYKSEKEIAVTLSPRQFIDSFSVVKFFVSIKELNEQKSRLSQR